MFGRRRELSPAFVTKPKVCLFLLRVKICRSRESESKAE